jgi:predicted nucleotidyltransferase
MWLFGSYVRGTARPRSDLDLLVEFDDRPLTLIQFVMLEQELSDQLGVRVDLIEKKALKPALRDQILQEAIPL